MDNPLEIRFYLTITPRKGKKTPKPPKIGAWLPRIARLMALALKFDAQVESRELKDYADIARLGQISSSRISKVMSLTLLAPDIQEEILFLPQYTSGIDPWGERNILEIATEPLWSKQRERWQQIKDTVLGCELTNI